MTSRSLIFALIIAFAVLEAFAGYIREDLQVETASGWVQGKEQLSRGGRVFYSFEGIPYAKPPVRFQPPEPVESWEGVYNATYPRSMCPQFDPINQKYYDETEDCLYLNFYVPESANMSDSPLPTMLWIHGGGFVEGAGSNMGPRYFMDEDIVLVTINYRLGVFGFLNTGDKLVTGNMAIRDMMLALQSARENALLFGGSMADFTIFGESAGGASVHALVISPLSSGKVSRAIAQSGTMLSPWAFAKDPRKQNEVYYSAVGCKNESMIATVDCLKNKTIRELLAAPSGGVPFSPSLDTQAGDAAVFPKSPRELMETGAYIHYTNFTVGFNEAEAAGWALGVIGNDATIAEFNTNWTTAIDSLLSLEGVLAPDKKLSAIAAEMKDIYLGGKNLTKNSLPELTALTSDCFFVWGCKQSAILHARSKASVYPYVFKYQGNFSLANTTGYPNLGPGHADDLQYLFQSLMSPNKNWPDLPSGSADEEFSKRFISLWASFGARGKPDAWAQTWSPVSSDGIHDYNPVLSWYRISDQPGEEIETAEMARRMEFWNRVFLTSEATASATVYSLVLGVAAVVMSLFSH